jgi:hypothetical protein
MWIVDLIQIQYYETLITLRGVHAQKGKVKEGKQEVEYG